jgi:hypothetical protein
MKRRHLLKGLAAASLVTAAVVQSGLAVADRDRLEREIREEGREEVRQNERMEREIREEGREEIRQNERMEREIREEGREEIQQEGRQKGRKLDRRL